MLRIGETVWYYGEDELEQGSLCWVSKEDNNE